MSWNVFWLVFEKALVIVDGLLIGAMVAAWLGPQQLGVLAYAGSLISMGTPLVVLGLDRIFVRDYSRCLNDGDRDTNRSLDFWSVFYIRFVAGLLLFVLLSTAVWTEIFPTSSREERQVLLWLSAGFLILPMAMARLVLEAELLSRWAVWISSLVLLFSASAKLMLIYSGSRVVGFAIAGQAAALLNAFCLIYIANKLHLFPRFQLPTWLCLKRLLLECWPLALSGVVIALYMSMDISMLRFMRGASQAGIYSVAVQVSSFLYFLPMVLASTFLPSLTRLYQKDSTLFWSGFRSYLDLNYTVCGVAMLLAIFACPTLIVLLFGEAYVESSKIVRVHLIAVLFVAMGVAKGQFFLLAKLHRLGLYTSLCGLATNLILNLLLIPAYGGYGAAIATCVSYFVVAVASTLFFEESRLVGREILTAMGVGPIRCINSLAVHWNRR